MKEDTARRIADILVELKQTFPNMRMGQLVATVAQHAKGPAVEAVYDVTDEDFLKAARELLGSQQHEHRSEVPAHKIKRAI